MAEGALSRGQYEAIAAFRYRLRQFLAFNEAAATDAGLPVQQHQALLIIAGYPEGEVRPLTASCGTSSSGLPATGALRHTNSADGVRTAGTGPPAIVIVVRSATARCVRAQAFLQVDMKCLREVP